MADPVKPPAPHPCGSCPYRRDVPSGIWDATEYDKLPQYDGETFEQPIGVFLCHRQDGRACAGWCGVHDMEESLAIRIGASSGRIEDPEPFWDYTTDVELWGSGAEAAEHGLREITSPGREAQKTMAKLRQQREET